MPPSKNQIALTKYLELKQEQDRRSKGLSKIYRPSIYQEPIHRSSASELIVRGGKRAGKSVAVSREFASRVTGEPVIAADGTEIPLRYPAPSKEFPKIYWIIGWDTKHIGQTIYRLLFEKGQGGSYRVIKDLKTNEYRTWNRGNPSDRARIAESELSEPLIPERMLEGGFEGAFEWEDKKAHQFNSCRLTNGAIIYAFPSSARNPKQGDAVSGIWIDEDIMYPSHLKEWQDRLPDEEGWLMWSVWPHMKNEALMSLIARAEMAEFDDNPQIESFQLIMSENPFLSEKGKKESLGRMDTDEQIKRRDRGELLTDALSMCHFNSSVHQIQRPLENYRERYDLPKAHKMLRDQWLLKGSFPKTWTRYISIDPSNTRTACHSWVIPPPEYNGTYLGNLAISEWELVARRFNATMLATELLRKMGTNPYEAFIMDQMAGRQTHAGREENTFGVYEKALQKAGLRSRLTSYTFIPGCPVPQTRYRVVRDLLDIQDVSGIPTLMFVEETNIETKREFEKYRKKFENRSDDTDSVLDEPTSPRLFDAMASVEYFAAYIEPMFLVGQAYVDPELYAGKGSPAYKYAQKILKNRGESGDDSDVVYFGGGDYSDSHKANSSVLLQD